MNDHHHGLAQQRESTVPGRRIIDSPQTRSKIDMLADSESPEIQEFRLYRELSREIENSKNRVRYIDSEPHLRAQDRHSNLVSSSEIQSATVNIGQQQLSATSSTSSFKIGSSSAKSKSSLPPKDHHTQHNLEASGIKQSDTEANHNCFAYNDEASSSKKSPLFLDGNCQVCLIKEVRDNLTHVTRVIQERNEQLSSKLKEKSVISAATMISEVPTSETCNSETIHQLNGPILFKKCSFGDCMTKWTLEYLTEQLGDQTVVIHESSSDQLDFLGKNFKYRTCKFSEFSHRLMESRKQESADNIYLRSTSSDTRCRRPARIEMDFPVLAADLKPPSWVPYRDDALYHSSVLRIASDRVQIWTHFDLYDNVLCQVVGTKRVILFPPEDTKYMYVEGDKSRVNCLDNLQECFEKFPLVEKAHLHTVTLNPGDCLFIPALWWHNIRTVKSNQNGIQASDYTIGFNIFWQDQEVASQSQYANKDVYGNRNLVPYDAALTNVDRAVQQLDKLPEKYRKFYKLMLLQHIEKKLNLDL